MLFLSCMSVNQSQVCDIGHTFGLHSEDCFLSSTSRTFFFLASLLPILTVPLPMIMVELSFPKEIEPSLSFSMLETCPYHMSCALNNHRQHTNHVSFAYVVE